MASKDSDVLALASVAADLPPDDIAMLTAIARRLPSLRGLSDKEKRAFMDAFTEGWRAKADYDAGR